MECKFISHAPRPPRSPTREQQDGVAFHLTGVRDTLRYTCTSKIPTRLTPLSRCLLGIKKKQMKENEWEHGWYQRRYKRKRRESKGYP